MTQVEAPNASRADAPEPGRISHWIGGRIVAGTAGREGPVYDPAIRHWLADFLDQWIGARVAA